MRVLLLCLLTVALQALDVMTIDGEQLTDTSAESVDGQLRIGPDAVPLSRCDWLADAAGAPLQQPDLGIAPHGVRLVDGSYLPALDVRGGTGPDRLLVTSPFGSFDLPLTVVLAWGQRPTVLDLSDAGDADVLSLLNGQELRGEVMGLGPDGVSVQTDLADEPLVIAFETLRSVQMANPTQRPEGLHLRLVHDPSLPPIFLAPSQPWRLQVAADAILHATLPLPRLTVMGGAKRALSALDPVAVDERGAFEVVWPWARDRQIDGEPIQLRGRLYDRGIVLHSYASLRYALDGRYRRFRARAGIIDAMGYEGDCVLLIRCDGEQRVAERLRGQDPVVDIDLDLAGVAELEIVVEIGERYDIGDHVALADAFLILTPE